MRLFTICKRFWLPCLFVGAAVLGTAQTESVADGTMPVGIAPGTPVGSYAVAPFEHYDPFSGALNVSLPLHHIGGRGEAGFDLVWNFQQTWLAAKRFGGSNPFIPIDPYPITNIDGPEGAGGPLGAGTVFERTGSAFISCPDVSRVGSTVSRIVFEMPNGTQVEFVDQNTNGAVYNIPNACSSTPGSVDAGRGTIFKATNGSALEFIADAKVLDYTSPGYGEADTKVSGVLLFPNGVTYRIDNSDVSWIRDRNGNKITLQYSGEQIQAAWYLFVDVPSQITDSLGRVTSINYNDSSCGGCTTITYPGSNGSSRVIQIVQAHLSGGLLRSDFGSVETIDQLFPGTGQPTSYNFDPILPSYIHFPDGSQYTFRYDPYGELARITLPTGGAVEYDFGDGNGGNGDGFEGVTTDNNPVMIYRRLHERREYLNGGSGSGYSSKTDYSASTSQGGTTTATEQTYDPNGNLLAKAVHTIDGSPLDALGMNGTSCNAWNEGFETRTDYGAPNPLVTVTHGAVQQSGCMNNPQVASETVTLDDTNQVSQRTFSYDPYDNVNDEKDYDWGSGAPGALLRHMSYGYLWQTNSNYTNSSSYLVSAPTVMDIWDANGNHIAETVWHYDENPLQDDSGIVGHDPAYGTGFTYRANLTSLWKWLSSTGQFLPQRLMTYDIAGNPVTIKDGNGNQTSLGYSDNYADGQYRATFGHVTVVINALGQSPYQANYDFGTGQPELMADIMGQYRTRNYGGSGYGMDRLVQINYANGAHTYYSYPSATEVVTQQDQNSSGDGALKSQALYDSFGRATESDSFETASQYIATTEQYDAMGRISQTTNPSRPGDNLNYPTKYSYDSLGRVYRITAQDGSVTQIGYSGNRKTITDPAGKAKAYTYDALGRLINVKEDPNGVNYTTDYQYDTLGDLTLVSQGYCPSCEQRHFTYDSLGRLVSAANPESGTVSYAYDWANNLTSSTDARGVATAYTYDALNRLTGKSYSDGTPSVAYTYGTAGTQTGHLIAVKKNGISTTNFTSFDVVGNLLASNQVTAGETYSFAYGYNLAGSLVSETYPSGHVITMGRDGADRVGTLTGSLNGQVKTYASSVTYLPHGALYYYAAGNSIVPAWTYNSRLQPQAEWATIGNNPNEYFYSNTFNWGGTNNNGTLQGIAGYEGGPGPLSSLANFVASYGYDSANRLTSAGDSGGWSRSFGYDTWGNMWVTGNSGVSLAGNTPTSDVYNGANRINGGSYDAAGNDLSVNGDTLAYDAENMLKSAYDNVTHNTETYLYDGAGQRVEKTGPGGTTVYAYDGFGQLAAEYSTATNVSPCTTCYLFWDNLGSIRLVTDQNANVISHHDYLPYGQEIPANTAGRNGQWGLTTDAEQKFTGQIRDQETGMDYFQARYFASPLGRFNSTDPANAGADMTDPQTWNAYAYVGNNPLAFIDPSGLDRSNCGGVMADACVTAPEPPPLPLYWYFMNSQQDQYYAWLESQWSHSSSGGGGGEPTAESEAPLQVPLISSDSSPSRNTCVAGYGAAGAIWGSRAGWVGGGASALLGSETGPFDIAIAYGGKTLTSAVGTYVGLKAGQLLGNIFCASSSGSSGGGGTGLTPGARRKLGNLANRAGETVRDVIRSRGGTAANVNQAGQWADKTLGETAQAAANGDPNAETAIKIVKQAARLGQLY